MEPDQLERIAARLQNEIAQLSAQWALQKVMLQDKVEELEKKLAEKEES